MKIDTYIVLLNWNGWGDTVECLESLFRLEEQDFRVVVCDNSSADLSLERIGSWARGELSVGTMDAGLGAFVSPPVSKPVVFQQLAVDDLGRIPGLHARLILVETGSNLGFAGGNNVGLRIALQDPACRFVWLLNPDTVAAPHALTALRKTVEGNAEIGICGSLNLSYHLPTEVQARGGKSYNFWTGRVRKQPKSTALQAAVTPPPLDYINGASMFVTRRFLETVGLMDESYFLYFEELDWAMRSKGRFQLGYAPGSVIYHKEGAQIGSSPDRLKRSLLADQYLSRNRILFTRRFVPWALPSVMACIVLAATERLLRGDARRAGVMLASMVEGLRHSKKSSEATCADG